MNASEVVAKLHEFYEKRDALKLLRRELEIIAIDFGQDQMDASRGGAVDFLDGYLAGTGRLPYKRGTKE